VFNGDQMEMRAGTLAEAYKKLGGDIFCHGKPYSNTYDIVFHDLENISKSKILMVGDSLLTDILGANSVKMDSLLVASLTLRHELKLDNKPLGELNFDLVNKSIKEVENRPTYYIRK